MKNLVSLLVLVITLTSCQNEKTAFVDNKKIVENFDLLQTKEAFYKEAEDSLQLRIENMVAQSGYQDLVNQYQTQSDQLSDSEKEDLYNQIMQLQQSIGQQQQMANQGLQQQKGKDLDSLTNIVKAFIKDYGKDNGYSYIFGSNEGGNVLYGSDEKDLTDMVIEELNNEYKVEETKTKTEE